MTRPALLLSGGIDSAALAYWQRPAAGVFVNYGQRAAGAEGRAAAAVARALALPLFRIDADLSALGQGNMVGRPQGTLAATPEWWPFRNQMLITLAAMRVVTEGIDELMIGTVSGDATHRDGSEDFVSAIDQLLALQEGGLRLRAPARQLTSAELIRTARVPQEIIAWTHSCHVSDLPCGNCRGCRKHVEVLGAVGYAR